MSGHNVRKTVQKRLCAAFLCGILLCAPGCASSPGLSVDENEPHETDGISLQVTAYEYPELKAVIVNGTDESFWYGNPFDLKIRMNGEWQAVSWREDPVWTMIACELAPHESAELTFDLSLAEELGEGEYQLSASGLEACFRLR